MTIKQQAERIESNRILIESSKSLSDALDACRKAGVLYKQLNETTCSIYGWTFGTDSKGFYFFRVFDQKE